MRSEHTANDRTARVQRLAHATRELNGRKYLKALETALQVLTDAGIDYLNSEDRRPVHTARDMGKDPATNADMILAPMHQSDEFIGLVTRGRTLTAQVARHALAVRAFLDRDSQILKHDLRADVENGVYGAESSETGGADA